MIGLHLLYHIGALQLDFPPLSQPLARDTLPISGSASFRGILGGKAGGTPDSGRGRSPLHSCLPLQGSRADFAKNSANKLYDKDEFDQPAYCGKHSPEVQ